MSDDLKPLLRGAGLSSADCDRYVALLTENGFENEKLLRRATLEDLTRIGIDRVGHAKAVISAATRLQRTKTAKRHAFYVSHDKVDSGTEASMVVDAASLRFSDKPAFIDSDHRYLKQPDEFLGAMLASNFCVILLTPRYLSNPQCLAELVWAVQTDTPICVIHLERLGLPRIDEAMVPRVIAETTALLSPADWSKLNKMNIFVDQVHLSLLAILQNGRERLVFQPHESREVRAGFFSSLWRIMGEIAAAETGAEVFAIDERVDVRWRKGERWYSGRVSFIAANGTYSIEYDDGDRESGVTAEYMQRHRRPPVVRYQQDERVEARWRRRNVYFPGRVVAIYENLEAYDIVYDDGDIEFRVSYELMRKVNAEPPAAPPLPAVLPQLPIVQGNAPH